MLEYKVPEYFINGGKEIPSACIFPYEINKTTSKNRVVLTTHLFSFLEEGSKQIVTGRDTVYFDKKEFALITAGRCFMSEKVSGNDKYSCILLFFDNNLLQDFFETQKNITQDFIRRKKLNQKEILLFPNDEFTKSYIRSLRYLHNKSEDLAKVKTTEILLYLMETHPAELCCLFAQHPNTSQEINFKNIIASHIDSSLTVSELAYLCNVSLSTFKRKFTAIYNDTPTNWIRQKRMEHAAFLLKYNKERVSDIYLRLGYENHSSFSQSFKSIFGVSPREYQLQN